MNNISFISLYAGKVSVRLSILSIYLSLCLSLFSAFLMKDIFSSGFPISASEGIILMIISVLPLAS